MDFDQKPPPLPPVPEARSGDNVLLKLVIGGCGCLIVIAAVLALFYGRLFGFMRGPSRVVESHLKAINDEDYRLAYGMFTRDFRSRTSFDQFRQNLREFSTLLPYKAYSLNRVSVNNNNARVEGTITGRDGAIFPVRYDLIREQGKWKILSYEWTAPGERQTVEMRAA